MLSFKQKLDWFAVEFKRDWKKPSNIITLIRLVLGLFPSICLFFGLNKIAVILFLVLISSDWIDGLVARCLDMRTKLGRILDPIADRLILGSVLIVLIFQNLDNLAISLAMIWLLIASVIIFMFIYRALINYIDVKPNASGKLKTVLLAISIIGLIAEGIGWLDFMIPITPYLITATVAASIFSLLEYVIDYWDVSPKKTWEMTFKKQRLTCEFVSILTLLPIGFAYVTAVMLDDFVPGILNFVSWNYDHLMVYAITIFLVFVIEEMTESVSLLRHT